MSNNKKTVIVVDAFSTGKYLPAEILKRGCSWVHVISRTNLPTFITSGIEHPTCEEEIIYDFNFNNLLKQLEKYSIMAVMAGAETSVELAEQLASALKLPGNSPETSKLRRNKFHMIEAIQQASLLSAKQCCSDKVDDLIAWYKENFQSGEMVVIKPINSAGTDHVTFCSSIEQLKNAAENILGQVNKLGILNQFVLAQSFLDGQEYVVNTVSLNGKHHLTDIWHCNKQRIEGAGFVPGCEVLLTSDGDVQQSLRDYAFKALDALQFVQGPAHFEIMLTARGPAIIEVGARIQGGVNPDVHITCMGTSQLVKSVDSYLNPEKFLSYYQQNYALHQYSRWADLIVPQSGTVKSFDLLEKVKTLPSFYSANIHVNPGDYLPKTVDLYTSPGSIYLVNSNTEQLAQDYAQLRIMEKQSYEFISE